jgi:parallel beta-helix repeat protein
MRSQISKGFWLALLCAAVCWPAGAAPALAQGDPPPPAEDEGQPGPPAAWDVVDAPPTPSASPTAPNGAATPRAAAAATDCLGLATRRVRYTSDGVIHLEGCGQVFRLSDIAAAGIGADKLELVDRANKVWLLKVKLKVEEGATLRVVGGAAGDVSWLRLLSTPAAGIWLRADSGNLLFQDTKVTSWDPAKNGPDTDPTVASDGSGGRSYIATRSVLTKGRPTAAPTACGVNGGSQEPYEGRMDVVNSEIGYLGYYASESYGIVWKVYYKVDPADPSDAPPPGRQLYALADVFGGASGSRFHHNYFGSYTFGGYCMGWSGNTFENNVMYGLDPHDDSDYLTIDNNIFRNNGTHGVICSVECDHLVIRNNQSYGNEHGIMLHRNTNGAIVEGNISRDNRGAGIAIFDSNDAVVRGNTVANNGESAVRLSVGSARNLIENNTLTGLAAGGTGPGYVIYTYKGSDAPTSGDGLPKNNIFRNNRLTGYLHPLMKISQATGNLFAGNTLDGPAADMALAQASGNILRDSPIGKQFELALDASSSVTLEDTRGAVWLVGGGLGATVAPSGASLALTADNAGASAAITTVDLRVRPAAGSIVVTPTAWGAGGRAWSERSSSAGGAVPHSVGGLAPGACYGVMANGAALAKLRADAAGQITFSYGGGYSTPVSFAASQATGCAAQAPAPRIFMPLLRMSAK